VSRRSGLLRGGIRPAGPRLLVVLFAVSIALTWPSAAWAQEDTVQAAPSTTVHPEARRAISEIRSPYCPGLMLEVCPSPDAAVLRDSIDTLARSGLTADSIVERVIARYGEEWRAVPRREGAGWWAWLMPPAALLAGLLVVVVVLARRRRATQRTEGAPDVGTEDEERVRRALADLEASEHPDW
jgi:cytochrome c-type biogenesis protein CcmH/NrfF